MSGEDETYNKNIISFGNGTIYLDVISPDTTRLYTQKTEDGSHFEEIGSLPIKKYKMINDFLYLIDENNSYIVVDFNAYVVLYECEEIEELPEEHQIVFNDGGFINTSELYNE